MTVRPTMRDVAASAGVSLKTVSRVVNDEPSVRQETARRVRSAIERLGFVPNELASGLRAGRAGALGLVIEDLGNPFYSSIARVIEDLARERGHLLLIGSCGEDPVRERDLVMRFLRRAVDALLLVPAGDDHRYLLNELGDGGVPIVAIDRPVQGITVDTVLADNRGGARLAAEHLLAQGHERIAALVDTQAIWTARERLAGYREALGAAGVDVHPELIRSELVDTAGAQAATEELLRLPPRRRPTALFTANNRITVGALKAMRAAGRQPAVVGFDDFELAEMLATPITVVRQPPAVLGRLAAEAAYARLDDPSHPPRQQVVTCELVVRGSGEVPR
jgi:LacI family transcriptional regulator